MIPITEDDRAIEAALQDAYVPLLMVTLVHLTGGASILRGSVRPNADFATFLGDPQGGIAETDRASIRARALEVLRNYRDGGGRLPPPPSEKTIHEMIGFILGQPPAQEYVDFLMAELGLDGKDAYAEPIAEVPSAMKERFHVVVVGAGMSGLHGCPASSMRESRFIQLVYMRVAMQACILTAPALVRPLERMFG